MRVLIATVTAGAGHLQAAAALDEVWRELRPRDSVQCWDVLEFTPRLYRKVYGEAYMKMVEHAPELWARIFNQTDDPARSRGLTRWRVRFARLTAQPFLKRLTQFRPDVVLCTHFLPLEMLGEWKESSRPGRRPAAVCVVTDFEAHALWMHPGVDLYCVAAEETKARLVARGAAGQQVAVTGIPISVRFSRGVQPYEVRRRLGLRDDLPVLLVLSGGFGVGPVAAILQELDKVESLLQTVVVCGRNEELRRTLAAQDRAHPTHVLGFVSNMHELMAAAELIIGKPGGLTSSEALATGKPLFIVNPIPGQEAANSDFLLEHGAAVKVNRVEDVPFKLDQLLGKKKLRDLAAAAGALGKPRAAWDICEEIVRRLKGDPPVPPRALA